MRKHLSWASAALALTVTACGSFGSSASSGTASPPTQACVNAAAAHKAYVVVQHQSGGTVEACVGFAGGQITGDELMRQSRIQHQTQTFSGIGKAVCQVDNEPAQFTECFPKDKPNWLMYLSSGGGPWTTPTVGFSALNLGDGDALGWRYATFTSSPAPPPLPKKRH